MSLVVVKAVGLVTVQDLGRRGSMHLAVPPGGALVPELLAIANGAAHNAADAAALEVQGQLVMRAEASIAVATDSGETRELAAGDEITVESGMRRCAYLAIHGGIDAPIVLGGRGTLLCAELGHPLRPGDILRRGDGPRADASAPMSFRESSTITVLPGPDHDAFASDALAQLVSAPYRILPSSDRVGLTGRCQVRRRTRSHGQDRSPAIHPNSGHPS